MYECDMCAQDAANAHVFNGDVLCDRCAICRVCSGTKALNTG